MNLSFVPPRLYLLGLSAALLLAAACGQDVLVGQGGSGGGNAAAADGVVVRGCVVLPRDTCMVQPSLSAQMRLGGSVDGLYRDTYTCVAIVENARTAQGSASEQERVSFTEARVQVMTSDGQLIKRSDGLSAQYNVPITGFADASSGGVNGVGAVQFSMLDVGTLQALTAAAASAAATEHVVAHVIIAGNTLGGTEVTSNELEYPIDVCAGCLCEAPIGDACVGGTSKPAVDCLIGEDAPADCRYLGEMNACKLLDCSLDPVTMKADVASAHCPAAFGAGDGSCCQP